MRYTLFLIALLLPASVFAQSERQGRQPMDVPGTVFFDPPATSKSFQDTDSLFYNSNAAFFAELPGDPTDDTRSGFLRYALRVTPATAGQLRRVVFAINNRAEGLVGSGILRVSIHGVNDSDPDLPVPAADLLGSVPVPMSNLVRGLNTVDFGGTNLSFEAGEEFFIVFQVLTPSDDARIEFLIDAGSTTTSDPNYYPARSLIFVTPPSAPQNNWFPWFENSNFLVAAVMRVNINSPPQVVSPIVDQNDVPVGTLFTFDLSTVFSDPDGDPLSFTAQSSAPGTASASVAGNTLTVNPLAAGSATIQVTASDGNGGTAQTSFNVSVIETVGDTSEPNDIASAATPITIGTTLTDTSIDPSGDVDYFRFDAAAGDFVDIVASQAPGSSLDGRLWLYDAEGNLLADADEPDPDADSRIQYLFSEAGTYFIRHAYYLDDEEFPNKQNPLLDGNNTPVEVKRGKAQQDDVGGYVLSLSHGVLPPPVEIRIGSGLEQVVGLEWRTTVGGAPSFRVYRTAGAGGPTLLIGTTNRTDFVDTQVVAGTSYSYYVTTYNAITDEASASSATFTATPSTDGINIQAQLLTTIPILDGQIEASEWADATPVELTYPTVPPLDAVRAYIKNDEETLYIAVDDPTVTFPDFSLVVYYDLDNNNSWDPSQPSREGRYQASLFSGEDAVTTFFRAFAGAYPNHTSELENDPPGFAAGVSDASGHAQYELAFDLSESNLQAQPGDRIGIAFYTDGPNGAWPTGSVVFAPSTFATLTLAGTNLPPSAAATADPTEAGIGQNITFDGSASADGDGSILSYAWDFGDGGTSTDAVATHAYEQAGMFTARLTVTDDEGATGQATVTVSILENQPPTAQFTASATQVATGTAITFDASASTDPDGSLTAYAWDFGDGASGEGVSTSHAYAQPGTYTVTLTVTDDAGGTAQAATTIEVAERVNEAPVLTHQPISEAVKGQDLTITATITDDQGIASANLTYLIGTAQSFVLPMTASGNTYQATIPGSAIDERGLGYLIDVVDSDAAGASTAVAVRVRVPEGLSRSISASGTTETAYRLVSVPLQLSNASVRTTLEDDLGNYDNTRWRFYALQNGEHYAELSDAPLSFALGQSYWLAVKNSGEQFNTGEGISAPLVFPFMIQLVQGWNFISNPFAYEIGSDYYEKESGEALQMWTYGAGGWTQHDGALRPFEGYAVLANTADRLLVYPNFRPDPGKQAEDILAQLPQTEPAAPAAKTDAIAFDWAISIDAESNGRTDRHTWAAVHAHAETAFDALDRAEPPPVPGAGLSVYFHHPEWQAATARFSTDARPLAEDGVSWTFSVESRTSAPVTLSFSDLQQVPAAYEIWLLDPLTHIRQNLREQSTYRVGATTPDAPRTLELVVARSHSALLEEALSATGDVPAAFVLENFPNPFNPTTTIRYGLPEATPVTLEVFNVLGERIALLEKGTSKAAGFHTAVWDGTSSAGHPVTSGLYFYRLETGTTVLTRTMVLAK